MGEKTTIRLNRYLAQCGLGSRRGAEDLIRQGKVAVNGVRTDALATQIDPRRDRVEVDGREVHPPKEKVCWMLNKAAGCDVTRGDPHAESTVFDAFDPPLPASVQAVGRLDRPTTGLLLLTNDGDLAFGLTHPRHGIEKVYLAWGEKAPTDRQIKALRAGMELEDGWAKPDAVDRFDPRGEKDFDRALPRGAGLRITLSLGRKRIVRRLCEAVGFPLERLHRIAVGPISLGDLRIGAYRAVDSDEMDSLRREIELEGAKLRGQAAQ